MNKHITDLIPLISFIAGVSFIVLVMLHYGKKADKICIDNEMQYFNLDKCAWNDDKSFGACKSDGMLFHFDFGSDLTEAEIKELEKGL